MNMKKLLSVLLAGILVFGAINITVMAAGELVAYGPYADGSGDKGIYTTDLVFAGPNYKSNLTNYEDLGNAIIAVLKEMDAADVPESAAELTVGQMQQLQGHLDLSNQGIAQLPTAGQGSNWPSFEAGMKNVTSIDFSGNTFTSIPYYMFYSQNTNLDETKTYDAITAITLPDTVEYFAPLCMNSMANLTTMNIPANMKALDNGALAYCPKLDWDINDFPSGVTFGKKAFQNSTSIHGDLDTFFAEKNPQFGVVWGSGDYNPNDTDLYSFEMTSCTGTAEALSQYEAIYRTALGHLSDNGGITGNLVIPDGIDEVYGYAFDGWAIESVTVSASTKLGENVFTRNENLETVNIVITDSDNIQDISGVKFPADTEVKYTVDGNLQTDPSAMLQTAIDNAPAGSIVEAPAGTYSGNIMVNNAITLRGADGAVFNGIIEVKAENAVLDNIDLHFEGTRTGASLPYGNIVITANNVTVKNCDFYAAYDEENSTGLGIEFGMVHVSFCTNVVFDNCTFETNTFGMFPTMKSGEIKNCTFNPLSGSTRRDFALNGSDMWGGVSITGNTFNGLRILTNGNGVTIEDNQFLGYTAPPIYTGWLDADAVVDLSKNYWGSENPDMDLFLGTSGKLIAESYYSTVASDGTLGGIVMISDDYTDVTKKVTFEQVMNGATPTNQIQVYLEGEDAAGNAATIDNLLAVDMTLALTGSFGFTFTPANDEWTYERYGNQLLIYEKGKLDGAADLSGHKILLGTLMLEGYGNGTISASSPSANAVEQRSKTDNLALSSSLVDGDTLNFAIQQPTQNLTVNVTFPNAVTDNAAAYQDMTVTVSGGDLQQDLVYALGADETAMANGAYTVEIADTLTQNISYTVTVAGAGYRTARYTVSMTEDKALTFWNNVKDTAQAVETGKTTGAVTSNFLAGDIVADNQINLYDLSAVVSYFGMVDLSADNNAAYAKYDLNRDGKIDSKDVAYVLVSWGN